MAEATRKHLVGSAAKDGVESGEERIVSNNGHVSILEGLKDALAEKVEAEPLKLTVPLRPAVALVFMPVIDFDDYNAWARKARDKKNDDIDYMKMANTVISRTNVGILFNGQPARDSRGEDLTITHATVHNSLGVSEGSTVAAIKKLYMNDGHAIQAMKLIVEAAGYTMDGDVAELDDEDTPLAK